MASLVLHVRLGRVTKKVVCQNTLTVNQLIELAVSKFGEEGMNGELTHGGKRLDRTLPLRLTNIVNNSRVELELQRNREAKEVQIKLNMSDGKDTLTYVDRVSDGLSIKQVLETFETKHNIRIFGKGKFETVILNARVKSDDAEMSSSLRLIAGDVGSLVMRLAYSKREGVDKEEQLKINRKQVEQMREYQRQEKARREILEKERLTRDVQRQEAQSDEHETPTQSPLVAHEQKNDVGITKAQDTDASYDSNSSQELSDYDKSDTLYVPSKVIRYENPEEDYEMTVDQAKIYHKLVVASGKRHPKKERQIPSEYSVRIRFPDQKLLQLHIPDSSTKLGNFLKKLDLYLSPTFKSNYVLKLGHPPFAKLTLSFAENEKPLNELMEFQEERIVLIWEPLSNDKGPFIKESLLDEGHVKQLGDLPEVKEEQRGNRYISEGTTTSTSSRTTNRQSKESDGKFPKWLKIGKK